MIDTIHNLREGGEPVDDLAATEVKFGLDTSEAVQEKEIVPVGVGTRTLGEFIQRQHRIDTAALPTGRITLRRVMPNIARF